MTLPAVRPPRCALTARGRGDQLFGTAAPGQRWLLIEHGGPWPRRAFEASQTLTQLAERATASGVRAVLVRRPGRAEGPGSTRLTAYVDARPGREGMWWSTFTDERELLTRPFEPAGTPSDEPIQLVCSHGKHDTCCAVEGRPVAAALAGKYPESTWECSHIGGDRFAPNVVLLPHGFYYGCLDPGTALAVAEAYRAGAVVPEYLRGRSVFPPAVQAAQQYARLATEDHRVDAFAPRAVEALDERTTQVVLAGDDGDFAVTVRADWSAPNVLSCAAAGPQRARVFSLLDP